MFPYNTLITEGVTGEICQTPQGAQTYIESLPYKPVIINSHKRVLANARQASMITLSEGWEIPYNQDNRYWDPTNLSSLPSYDTSDGVRMSSWYNQANLNLNLNGLANITPGQALDYPRITGTGIFPCFQVNNFEHSNNYDLDFTWIALMRFSQGGESVDFTNWRTNSSNLLIDGRVGYGTDDFALGLGSSNLWIGMGNNGSYDTFVYLGTDVVNSLYEEPMLIIFRRSATSVTGSGYVNFRINRQQDLNGEDFTSNSFSNIPSIKMSFTNEASYISELYVFNDYLDDDTVYGIENYFQAFYDLNI